MPFITDKRLYLTEDRSRVVEEGPEAKFLLASEGSEVSDEDVKKYGLTQKAPAAAATTEQPPAEEPEPDAKQITAPPENKAQTMRSGKEK